MVTKIFGIGLSKTGTQSMSAALERLGYRCAHWPKDRTSIEEITSGRWRDLTIYNKYDCVLACAAVDRSYQKLYEEFPDSKFILTTRPLESWINSASKWFKERPRTDSVIDRLRFFQRTVNFGDIKWNREKYTLSYIKHNRTALKFFGDSERFLHFELWKGHGYNELCSFLGREVPNNIGNYPHKNKSRE